MDNVTAVEVDGLTFAVSFGGFHETMEARTSTGASVHFKPWTCRQHLTALERHLSPARDGVRLDATAYAHEVLRACGIPDNLWNDLAPLALWWAAGGGVPAAAVAEDGWLHATTAKLRLRAWTSGERLHAMAANLRSGKDGAPSFSIAGYLDAMLRASLVAVDPPGTPFEDFDSETTSSFLREVIGLNSPEGMQDAAIESLRHGTQEMAVNTLRLCRAMGYTPSEVWALPAREVDRLLEMLRLAEGSPQPPPHRSPALTDYPDAVVIDVLDETS